jgi:elongation factor 1-beta
MTMISNSLLENLNRYLESRSYIEGFQPLQSDVVVYDAIRNATNVKPVDFAHVARWLRHIESFGEKRAQFPGKKKSIEELGLENLNVDEKTPLAKSSTTEKEDIDFFDSDDEEDAEMEKLKQERLNEYNKKKASKPKVIAKTSVTLEVKPWDDDQTNLELIQKGVYAIEKDGLLWGAYEFVPIGYGIQKLKAICVVEDEKVSIDDLTEQIATDMEDLVQSVDAVNLSKI